MNELSQRLAVASERNRQNNEAREALLKTAKDVYNCESIEELRVATEEKRVEASRRLEEATAARAKADAAVVAVEIAVGIRT